MGESVRNRGIRSAAPRSRPCADDGGWWEPSYAPTGSGSVYDMNQDEPAQDGPPIVLWVPDIEQRRGWREYYVRGNEKPNGKPPKRMGY